MPCTAICSGRLTGATVGCTLDTDGGTYSVALASSTESKMLEYSRASGGASGGGGANGKGSSTTPPSKPEPEPSSPEPASVGGGGEGEGGGGEGGGESSSVISSWTLLALISILVAWEYVLSPSWINSHTRSVVPVPSHCELNWPMTPALPKTVTLASVV